MGLFESVDQFIRDTKTIVDDKEAQLKGTLPGLSVWKKNYTSIFVGHFSDKDMKGGEMYMLNYLRNC